MIIGLFTAYFESDKIYFVKTLIFSALFINSNYFIHRMFVVKDLFLSGT